MVVQRAQGAPPVRSAPLLVCRGCRAVATRPTRDAALLSIARRAGMPGLPESGSPALTPGPAPGVGADAPRQPLLFQPRQRLEHAHAVAPQPLGELVGGDALGGAERREGLEHPPIQLEPERRGHGAAMLAPGGRAAVEKPSRAEYTIELWRAGNGPSRTARRSASTS